MTRIAIHHRTEYRYHQSVLPGPHRLLLRPRESRDLRILSMDLHLAPGAAVTWSEDVFGNAIATVQFDGWTDRLEVTSAVELELTAPPFPIFDIAASAITYPFRYGDDEWTDLGGLTALQYADTGRLQGWARGFVFGGSTDTLSLLKDLSAGVFNQVRYQSREQEGTQGPLETLDRGWGSCRDMAVLFAEAARSLGFGARIVSGYLFNADAGSVGSADSGSTHAWTEVFVPGAGWITFDSTNRSVGGFNLIPVAVSRSIEQVAPVSGSYSGLSRAFAGMSVEVNVAERAG